MPVSGLSFLCPLKAGGGDFWNSPTAPLFSMEECDAHGRFRVFPGRFSCPEDNFRALSVGVRKRPARTSSLGRMGAASEPATKIPSAILLWMCANPSVIHWSGITQRLAVVYPAVRPRAVGKSCSSFVELWGLRLEILRQENHSEARRIIPI